MAKFDKLLVIDDDQTHNLICENLMLEGRVFNHVECLLSIQEGINYLNACPIDEFPNYIFLDLMFPNHTGWQFMELYKQRYKDNSQTKIYIITASVSKNDWKKAQEEPLVCGFINKPFTDDKLKNLFD